MSRAATGDVVMQKAGNNVYTVLSAVALLASILALVVVFLRAQALYPPTGLM